MPSAFRPSYDSGQATMDSSKSGFILESNASPLPHQPHSYPGHSLVPLEMFHPYGLPLNHMPEPLFFPQYLHESLHSLDGRDELDVHTLPNVQHQHFATSVGDKNAPAGSVAIQVIENMQPYHAIRPPDQETLYDIQDTLMSFPTLEIFSPPVADLHQWPQSQSSNFQYSAIAQAHSHPAQSVIAANYETDLDASHCPESSTVMDPNTLAAGQSNAPCPLQVDNFGGYAHPIRFLDWIAPPPKHKTFEGVETADASSSGARRRRRRHARSTEGMFGEYALADASATIMVKPLVDHHPVVISGRRTHDGEGEALQTRKYGVMEIDNHKRGQSATHKCGRLATHKRGRSATHKRGRSATHKRGRSATVAKDLPAGLACVRACEWTDQPCGLYVEINKTCLADHLLYWHGVHARAMARCKFKGCLDSVESLGRHVTTVHYATCSECDYCGEEFSRSDAVARHHKGCESVQSARKSAGDTFKLQPAKTIIYGYIVPAGDAK
ncbi:hypothetical protein EV702DRAFT_1194173 [Suillus placidus]|uniref:C2H2-type domain-containing protein n=1 Tax=Suillus placidus TaxID=48579 RepID=A0A9P7A1C7_9AGAM|nr:hypothetical protein EV702DRAFT_1194173 [Suillus placidus]